MDRRAFIGTLAGGLLAAPLAAETQVIATVPRIGVLAVVPRSAPGIRAFDDRLQQLGYVDGRTIRIEFRAAADHLERMPVLAMCPPTGALMVPILCTDRSGRWRPSR